MQRCQCPLDPDPDPDSCLQADVPSRLRRVNQPAPLRVGSSSPLSFSPPSLLRSDRTRAGRTRRQPTPFSLALPDDGPSKEGCKASQRACTRLQERRRRPLQGQGLPRVAWKGEARSRARPCLLWIRLASTSTYAAAQTFCRAHTLFVRPSCVTTSRHLDRKSARESVSLDSRSLPFSPSRSLSFSSACRFSCLHAVLPSSTYLSCMRYYTHMLNLLSLRTVSFCPASSSNTTPRPPRSSSRRETRPTSSASSQMETSAFLLQSTHLAPVLHIGAALLAYFLLAADTQILHSCPLAWPFPSSPAVPLPSLLTQPHALRSSWTVPLRCLNYFAPSQRLSLPRAHPPLQIRYFLGRPTCNRVVPTAATGRSQRR